MPRNAIHSLALVVLTVFAAPIGAVAQTDSLPLRQAAAVTELQLGPWGPYAVGHTAPCYLADRFHSQLFAFPIVIGQRRIESRTVTGRDTAGKFHTKVETVAMERRSMGLSAMDAAGDDRPIHRPIPGSPAAWNRTARVMEADAQGLLYTQSIAFAPAEMADADTVAGGSTPWGAADAIVEYCPAFAEPGADGLPIRVTISNKSDSVETFYVDLLGGIGLISDDFALRDLHVEQSSHKGCMIVSHTSAADSVFALVADAPYPVRGYRVSNAYFAPDGRICSREPDGTVIPHGIAGEGARAEDTAAKARTSDAGLWALTRVDEISVAPGESRVINLCIGVAKDAEAARSGAVTLAQLSNDVMLDGQVSQQGAFSKALEAHRTARFHSGDAALDRLMVQSLYNIPFVDWRRVGVSSRQSPETNHYTPVSGAFTALGWAPYRPDWAAEQLNAWLLSRGDADAPIRNPRAVAPITLFALYDIVQQTGDHGLLEKFYPFAARRYRELLAAGRVSPTAWLYAWPSAADETARGESVSANKAGSDMMPGKWLAPDYSAYLVRAALVMQRMATRLGQSAEASAEYTRQADQVNADLQMSLWDATLQTYVARPVPGSAPQSLKQAGGGSLAELLPLIIGASRVPADRREALVKRLMDPAQFWSPYGLRSRSMAATDYMSSQPGNGAVGFGLNWLFWKALLDLGEGTAANQLADKLIAAYDAASTTYNGCPQWLDATTGAPGGESDSSGDSMALIPIYLAYHRPGTITTGWSADVISHRYDAATDRNHIVFRCADMAAKSVILCGMGKPNGHYILSGSLTGPVTADAHGVVSISAPADTTTQSLDIAPADSPTAP